MLREKTRRRRGRRADAGAKKAGKINEPVKRDIKLILRFKKGRPIKRTVLHPEISTQLFRVSTLDGSRRGPVCPIQTLRRHSTAGRNEVSQARRLNSGGKSRIISSAGVSALGYIPCSKTIRRGLERESETRLSVHRKRKLNGTSENVETAKASSRVFGAPMLTFSR